MLLSLPRDPAAEKSVRRAREHLQSAISRHRFPSGESSADSRVQTSTAFTDWKPSVDKKKEPPPMKPHTRRADSVSAERFCSHTLWRSCRATVG